MYVSYTIFVLPLTTVILWMNLLNQISGSDTLIKFNIQEEDLEFSKDVGKT